MVGEIGVSPIIIDEIHSLDIQGDRVEGESGVTRSIIDELHSCDIQGVQMEGESGVTRNIIDEFRSWDIQGDQMEGESKVLFKVSSMNLILGMSMEMKLNVKVVLLEVSLMSFIVRDPSRPNGK